MILKRHRMRYLGVMAVGLMVIAGFQAGASAARAPKIQDAKAPLINVIVGTPGPTGSTMPIYTPTLTGLYKRYGLNVQVLSLTSASASAALLAGSINFATTNAAIAGEILDPGVAKIVGNLGPSQQLLYVPASITSLAQLQGKTIATTSPGGSGATTTLAALHAAGLTPGTNVNVDYTGTLVAGLAALLSGTVQAALLNAPTAIEAQNAGFHAISLLAWTSPAAISVNEAWAKKHKLAVVKFLEALCAATKQSAHNELYSEAALNQFVGSMTTAELQGTWEQSKEVWECEPYSVTALKGYLEHGLNPPSAVNPKSLIDSSYFAQIPSSDWVVTPGAKKAGLYPATAS